MLELNTAMVLYENFALLAWEIGAFGVSLSWHMPARLEGGLNIGVGSTWKYFFEGHQSHLNLI